jgi:hypothetical protein
VSNDIGIGLNVPQYDDKNLINAADFAYWEAVYGDGTVQRETDGRQYSTIDRANLKEFRIIHHGEVLISIFPNAERGSSGRNLVYRRRTTLNSGANYGRNTKIILGFAPMGPVFSLDIDNQHCQISEDGFIPGDEEFSPPVPFEYEPQMLEVRT